MALEGNLMFHDKYEFLTNLIIPSSYDLCQDDLAQIFFRVLL